MTVSLNNRYTILRVLGSGGFGETFLAEDTHLPSRRTCVVKQLKPATEDPDVWRIIQKRFQREAAILELLGRLNDQIPELYAYFTEADQFYLVQELVGGPTLTQEVLNHGPFDESRAKHILTSLLYVLDAVHSQGIIHRDIKPDNVIIRESDSEPVLIDFGAVKEIVSSPLDSHGQPISSIRIGSPGFMPLEQAAGKPVFASDLYSLAVTITYLLTGRTPQSLSDHSTGELNWLDFAPGVSVGFAAVINKAVAVHFRDRFKSAREMILALENSCPDALQETIGVPVDEVKRAVVLTPTLKPTLKVEEFPDLNPTPADAVENQISPAEGFEPENSKTGQRNPTLSARSSLTVARYWKALGLAAIFCLMLLGWLLWHYRSRPGASSVVQSSDSQAISNPQSSRPDPGGSREQVATPTNPEITTGPLTPSPTVEPGVSVAGTWSLVVSDKGDAARAVLILTQQENKLTGTISFSENGRALRFPVNGDVSGNRVRMTYSHRYTRQEMEDMKDDESFAGATFATITLSGTVESSARMSGLASGRSDKRKLVGGGRWVATRR